MIANNDEIIMEDEYKDIYNNLTMRVDTNIKLESVILTAENKNKIEEFIKEIAYADKIAAKGIQTMNRLLFYGSSGCGKTYLGKALSNNMKYPMLYVDIARAISEGNVANNLTNIFKLANHLKKCIIFMDECDSIAWNRDAADAESGNIRRATNSLFQLMDQMNPNTIIICATNLLSRLDPAFERRFNMKLEFRRPEIDIKDAVKSFILPGFKINDNVDETVCDIVSRRAGQYAKLSYYELQGLIERSMKKAIMSDSDIINTADIYNDLAIAMNVKLKFKTDKDIE